MQPYNSGYILTLNSIPEYQSTHFVLFSKFRFPLKIVLKGSESPLFGQFHINSSTYLKTCQEKNFEFSVIKLDYTVIQYPGYPLSYYTHLYPFYVER